MCLLFSNYSKLDTVTISFIFSTKNDIIKFP
jgi:hypothetical protein